MNCLTSHLVTFSINRFMIFITLFVGFSIPFAGALIDTYDHKLIVLAINISHLVAGIFLVVFGRRIRVLKESSNR